MKKEIFLKGVSLFGILIFIFLFLISLREISLLTGKASDQGFLDIAILGQDINVSIDSPLNVTYYFNVGSNYSIQLNVSADSDVSQWKFTLIDLEHNTIIYNNQSFSPNASFVAVRGSNELTVSAFNSRGSGSAMVIFSVEVPNSAPYFGDLNSSIFVCEGDYLYQDVEVFDADEDALLFDINPKDPFFLFPVFFSGEFNQTVVSIVSSILQKKDVGVHEEELSVTDLEYADYAYTNITVIGINNAPVMEPIGVKTIWSHGDNSTLFFRVNVGDIEDGDSLAGKLQFNISFLNNESLFNISKEGLINFTAQPGQEGNYDIKICVTDLGLSNIHPNISLCNQDGSNLSVCGDFELTITDENRPPYFVSYYPLDLSLQELSTFEFYFNITTYDLDLTIPDIYWYIDDKFKKYSSGNYTDEFSNVFGCGVGGNHNVSVRITDGELNASLQWNITLIPASCPVSVSGGGGGGGGGGGLASCTPKWVCGNWGTCQSVNLSLFNGILSNSDANLFTALCLNSEIDLDFCGYQVRDCFDLAKCGTLAAIPEELRVCYYLPEPNCFDGVKNCHDGLCELLIDCGGPCPPCATCSDNIKNQGEEGVDCGGPCPRNCPESETFIEGLNIKYIFYWILIILLLIMIILTVIKLVKIIKSKREEEKLEWYKL